MKTEYYPVYRCKRCNHRLSRYEKMHSSGMCPHCGHNPPWAVTICEHYTETWRQVELRPWWKVWVWPRYKYEKVE